MRTFSYFLGLAGLVAAALPAAAQDYPNRPVRIIVPYAVGSPLEIEARALGQFMEPRLKQPFIVENKPGAASAIGTEQVAKSAPDGYTLIYTGAALSTLPVLQKINFDPVKDFAPISIVTDFVSVLVTNKDTPANTLNEFLALAKSKPGKMNYASAGRGSILLSIEALKKSAGVDMLEVPYSGQGAYIPALMSNDVQLAMASAGSIKQNVDAGALKILVVLNPQRVAQLPGIPTSKELGYDRTITSSWNGLLAPAGTPKAILDKLANEVKAYVATDAVKQRAQTSIFIPVGSTPEEFKARIENDTRIWQSIAKDINLQPE